MLKLNILDFISKSTKIHNNKYDYSQVNYINNSTKVKIICEIHGEFEQTPNSHMKGAGCRKCYTSSNKNNFTKNKLTLVQFIKKCIEIHGHTYDYSKVNYKHSKVKIIIICKVHGEFEQTPNCHLRGNGCPYCKKSKSENHISNFLRNNNIEYIPQMKFDNCKGKKRRLPFDFYLPKYNIAIEYDGKQHIYGWNNNKYSLECIKNADLIKNNFCQQNQIYLIRISHTDNLEQCLNDIKKMVLDKP